MQASLSQLAAAISGARLVPLAASDVMVAGLSTDSRSVREFLDTPFAGVKVIFSTYQSVEKAIKPALRRFP